MRAYQTILGEVHRSLTSPSAWAASFGGQKTPIGTRIVPAPPEPSIDESPPLISDDAISASGELPVRQNAEINYRGCSWRKTAALLFADYICLAVMGFPSAYSHLG